VFEITTEFGGVSGYNCIIGEEVSALFGADGVVTWMGGKPEEAEKTFHKKREDRGRKKGFEHAREKRKKEVTTGRGKGGELGTKYEKGRRLRRKSKHGTGDVVKRNRKGWEEAKKRRWGKAGYGKKTKNEGFAQVATAWQDHAI